MIYVLSIALLNIEIRLGINGWWMLSLIFHKGAMFSISIRLEIYCMFSSLYINLKQKMLCFAKNKSSIYVHEDWAPFTELAVGSFNMDSIWWS